MVDINCEDKDYKSTTSHIEMNQDIEISEKQIKECQIKDAKIAQQAYEQVGQVVEQSDMSYSDFLCIWIEKDCKLTCKKTTIESYKKKIRLYLKLQIGSYRLKAIPKDVFICNNSRRVSCISVF